MRISAVVVINLTAWVFFTQVTPFEIKYIMKRGCRTIFAFSASSSDPSKFIFSFSSIVRNCLQCSIVHAKETALILYMYRASFQLLHFRWHTISTTDIILSYFYQHRISSLVLFIYLSDCRFWTNKLKSQFIFQVDIGCELNWISGSRVVY